MARSLDQNVGSSRWGELRFSSARQDPTAACKDVLTPRADTLVSPAWLALSRELRVFSTPDEGDRWIMDPEHAAHITRLQQY